jgi:hypothetical protein
MIVESGLTQSTDETTILLTSPVADSTLTQCLVKLIDRIWSWICSRGYRPAIPIALVIDTPFYLKQTENRGEPIA